MFGLIFSGVWAHLPLFVALFIPLACVYSYLRFINSYWQRNGVSFVPATPFLGNMTPICTFRTSVAEHLADMYFGTENRSEPVLGMHIFTKPALLILDLDLIKTLMVKDFSAFNNRYSSSDIHTDMLGSGNLFFVKNPSWKNIRSRMTPFFTTGKMKQMYQAMYSIATQLNGLLTSMSTTPKTGSNNHQSPPPAQVQAEMNEIFACYTTDIIAKCAFGVEANSLKDPNSEFRTKGREMFKFTWSRAVEFTSIFFLPAIVPYFRFKTFSKSTTKFLREAIEYVMDERQKSGDVRNDLIDTLITLREEDKDKPFSTSNIVFQGDVLPAQAGAFFTAGFETSSSTLSFGLFEMCRRPEIQNKLREEIRKALHENDGELPYEVVQNLEYLGMVISETLRMYPPLPFLDRECTVPKNSHGFSLAPYSDFVVPKGMPIIVPVFAIHRDPKYWPNPKNFDPERFSPDNKANIAPYSYLPFGVGPHNCIGERFGQLQTRLGFINFFRNHRAEPSERTPKTMRLDQKALLLRAINGVHLNIIHDPVV